MIYILLGYVNYEGASTLAVSNDIADLKRVYDRKQADDDWAWYDSCVVEQWQGGERVDETEVGWAWDGVI